MICLVDASLSTAALRPSDTLSTSAARPLLDLILRRRMRRLVLMHKDRLLRFGADLVFALCEAQGIEIVIVNRGEQPSFEQEPAQDVLEIITVFSARLYGARSHKTQQLLDVVRENSAELSRL